MTIDQHAQPVPGTPAPAAPQPPTGEGRNGLAVAGLVLAVPLAPVGLVLSLIGFVQAARRGQRGRALAGLGMVVSLVVTAGVGVAAYLFADRVTMLADPGCTLGKAAVLDNAARVSNQATAKLALQATVDGLATAEAKARHREVRAAMRALGDDYRQLVTVLETGGTPPPGLQDKIDADAATVDRLCSIGNGG